MIARMGKGADKAREGVQIYLCISWMSTARAETAPRATESDDGIRVRDHWSSLKSCVEDHGGITSTLCTCRCRV